MCMMDNTQPLITMIQSDDDQQPACTVNSHSVGPNVLFTNKVHQNECRQKTANSILASHTNSDSRTQSSEDLAHNTDEQRERRELAKNQAAGDWRAELTRGPLSSAVELNKLEKEICQCSPGENNPKYILMDKKFEVLPFPDLFPLDTGTGS